MFYPFRFRLPCQKRISFGIGRNRERIFRSPLVASGATRLIMMKEYTKREFLKRLGLGLVSLPFLSCFDEVGDESAQSRKLGAAPDTSTPPDAAELPEVSPDDLLLLERQDERYAAFNQGFNKRIQKLPKYIAVCRTEKGVQYALGRAVAENLPVAIKSGGHSFEGFSSNDGGMVINLSEMKQVEWLSADRVRLGPGCTLKEMQDALFPKKRLIPAGSCGTVGIAGLTLGGGYGFFSRKYGLTCDSLEQLELITSDGIKRTLSGEDSLFRACKGAGNGNFGVVTALTFTCVPMPATFSAHTFKFRNLDAADFDHLLQTWMAIEPELPFSCFSAFILNGRTLTMLFTDFEDDPAFPGLLEPFRNQSDQYTPSLNKPLPVAMRRYYGQEGPLNFKNASAGYYKGYRDLAAVSEALFHKVADNKGMILQINMLGGRISADALKETASYPHRDFPFLGELQAYWEDDSRAGPLISAFENIQNLLAGAGVKAHYRNYPDLNFNNWQEAYYGSYYPQLQALKRQVDPDNLFCYEQSIEG